MDQPGLSGKAFAVSSGTSYTLRDVVKVFEACSGAPVPVEWGARPYRSREVMVPFTGEALPGWSADVRLEQGLSGMLRGT